MVNNNIVLSILGLLSFRFVDILIVVFYKNDFIFKRLLICVSIRWGKIVVLFNNKRKSEFIINYLGFFIF